MNTTSNATYNTSSGDESS